MNSVVVPPRGIFKRDTKGRAIAPVTVSVERGRIRFFAKVLGFGDPVHHDVDAARAAGHPDLVAPPSFVMALDADATAIRETRGQIDAAALVGCDFRYLLHGDEAYAYLGLIYAGDEVEISTEVIDFYDKKGGAMEFVVLVSRVTHPERGLLLTSKRTLLHRFG